MTYGVVFSISYLILSMAVTIWVARTLFGHGQVFLDDIFKHEHTLASAVNKLLQVGFYLVNIGYIAIQIDHGGLIDSTEEFVVDLSVKVGWIVLILGFWHLFNLWVLFRMRRRSMDRQNGPKMASVGAALSKVITGNEAGAASPLGKDKGDDL